MISGRNRRIINAIKKKPVCYETLSDLFDMARVVYNEDNAELSYCLKITEYVKEVIACLPKSNSLNALYWKVLLWEAPNRFESFLLYMEKNRPYKKKFYEPRMNPLRIVAQDLQDLEDGKYDFYGLSMPPRVGKSTICIFFFAWIIGKRPDSHNAMSGHGGILADRFHNDLIKLTENEEYTFHEIFPDVNLQMKSSEKNELYYDAVESFATTTCRGIDGTWTGAVDISQDGYLYVDDLVRDRKESLSPKRLEGRYQDYLNILVDRKNDGSRELMVGTRWNVMDPLGKIEKQYKNNPRYKFRKLPALNEKGESNFDYPVKGFSTKYYHDMRDKLDKNEWMAKFMQTPFVREDCKIYGWSKQDGDPTPENPVEIESAGMKMSTGKNLLVYPYETGNGMYKGVTAIAQNGHISVIGKTLDGFNYYFYSGELPAGNYGLKTNGKIDGVKLMVYDATDKAPLNISNFKAKAGNRIIIYLNQGYSGITVDVDTDIVLTKAEDLDTTSYEPYTGGIPALYGDKIGIEACGKNLLNFEEFLKARGVIYTKESESYQITNIMYAYGRPYKFSGEDIEITISGIVDDITSKGEAGVDTGRLETRQRD